MSLTNKDLSRYCVTWFSAHPINRLNQETLMKFKSILREISTLIMSFRPNLDEGLYIARFQGIVVSPQRRLDANSGAAIRQEIGSLRLAITETRITLHIKQ
jgi:hypothetical protein